MGYNKEQMWDNLMNWDREFQVQIESMENMENLDAVPPGASAQNLVNRHASAVSNNPRSMDASMKTPIYTSKLFPNVTSPP
jgi:hypothetical protein